MAITSVFNNSSASPRIAILSSKCAGMNMVAEAIEKAIRQKWPNAIIMGNGPSDRLIDTLLPLGKCGIAMHEKAARYQLFKFIAFYVSAARLFTKWRESTQVQVIRKYIEETKPDLIISSAPLLNAPLASAAAKTDTPLLAIALDTDNRLFSHEWPRKVLAPYRYAIPLSCHELTDCIHRRIDRKKVAFIGYPVREEFLREYSDADKSRFRQELRIPEGKKTLLLMVGGSLGSKGNYRYVERAMIANQAAHYAVICGNHPQSKEQIEQLLASKGFERNSDGHFVKEKLSFDVRGFERDVYKFFAVSRCVVSKPGAGVFHEAIALNVPMLLDDTSGHIPWEGPNIVLAEEYGLGRKLASLDQFSSAIEEMLDDKTHHQFVSTFAKFKEDRKEQFQFGTNLANLSEQLIREARENPHPIRKRLSLPKLIQKVAVIALCILFFPFYAIGYLITEWIPKIITRFSIFSAFYFLNESLLQSRRQELIKRGAKPIEKLVSSSNTFLDAMRVRASKPNPNRNTIVMVLAKPYQKLHPRQYQSFLNEGYDVVLFNPSHLTLEAMKNDLVLLTKRLATDHPQGKIAFHGYCIGAHVAPVAAVEVGDVARAPITLIIDRGFGDSYELVEHVIGPLAAPFKKKISKGYNLQAAEKVANFRGPVLFVAPQPGKDRLLGRNGTNLTAAFYRRFQQAAKSWIYLPKEATHWSSWDNQTRMRAIQFLDSVVTRSQPR